MLHLLPPNQDYYDFYIVEIPESSGCFLNQTQSVMSFILSCRLYFYISYHHNGADHKGKYACAENSKELNAIIIAADISSARSRIAKRTSEGSLLSLVER